MDTEQRLIHHSRLYSPATGCVMELVQSIELGIRARDDLPVIEVFEDPAGNYLIANGKHRSRALFKEDKGIVAHVVGTVQDATYKGTPISQVEEVSIPNYAKDIFAREPHRRRPPGF